MSPDSILITLSYAVACAALIGALNARGTARIVIASVLTLFCFAAAVYQTARFATRTVQASAEWKPALLDTAHAALAAPANIPINGGDGDPAAETNEAREVALSLQSLHDSLAAEDPAQARALSDSAYQAMEKQSEAYLTQARFLRERAARLAGSASAGQEDVSELLNASANAIAGAALELKGFFRAENKDEEKKHVAAFQQSLLGAESPLRQAQARLGAAPQNN